MTESVQKIIKIGAIIQSPDGKLLVVKKIVPGRNTYIIPGGRPEGAETAMETLERELDEELGVKVARAVLFGEYDEKSEFEDASLHMTVFDVEVEGTPSPRSEIVEMRWIDKDYAANGISIGSTLAHHVVPKLVSLGRM
ncbi:NUDIX hydrolase [Actinoplanes sp. CA-131856]